MAYHMATIEVLLDVESIAEGCDAIAETIRPLLKEHAENPAKTPWIDWRYTSAGDPLPHDGTGFEYSSTGDDPRPARKDESHLIALAVCIAGVDAEAAKCRHFAAFLPVGDPIRTRHVERAQALEKDRADLCQQLRASCAGAPEEPEEPEDEPPGMESRAQMERAETKGRLTHEFDDKERDSILAAVRLWQHHLNKTPADFQGLHDIANNGRYGTDSHLSAEDIDSLCERLNS